MATKEVSNFEAQLFKTADKLRKNIDAAEYKNVVLGLVFLKYISDSFQELYEKLEKDEYSDPEDRDEYKAQNVFFVPETARWKELHARAKLPTIGTDLDNAMEAIEQENPELRNVLSKVYGKPNLDKTSLGELIDVITDIELKAEHNSTKDLLGRVYEYFLGEFASAEGKKGGQFYTPKSIVKLMVEMIEPYKGRVYDPACGSGGMFVMSEKFVEEHQGNIKDITIYGQESNQTTWKLSKMNLAIRNINSQFVTWNTEGSFLRDAHPDLKADFVIANPPFNQSDWGIDILADDARWKYGKPPSGNANFGWIQHMLYHLAPHGVMATVLSNSSLSSNSGGEGEIRKNLIQADLVDCIVALPKQLFYNTGIPACIWFLRRERTERRGEILFIDASEMGYMKDRVHRDLGHTIEINGKADLVGNQDDIGKIVSTYHNWRKGGAYENEKGYCFSADIDRVKQKNFILTPQLYVGTLDRVSNGISFSDNINLINSFNQERAKIIEEIDGEIIVKLEKYFPTYHWNGMKLNSVEMLEEVAQLIFDEWFSKYFSLDELPKGWNRGKFGDIFDITIGRTPPRIEPEWFSNEGNGMKWISIKDIGNGSTYITNTSETLTNEAVQKFNVPIIPKNTCILSFKLTVGRIAITNEEMLSNEAIAHLKIKDNSRITTEYIYMYLKKMDFNSLGSTSSIATAINSTTIKQIELITPDDDAMNAFNDLFIPIFKKIKILDTDMHDFYKVIQKHVGEL